jgi:ATPase subunit of ABC transporter with duplicated ATPase domains
MSLIRLSRLGVHSPRVLFQNLDLTIHPANRVGLIAANGAGKTTLLRCLTGQTEPGSGEIVRRRGLRIAYVEQDLPHTLLDLPLQEAVRRALPPAEREENEWKVGLVLNMLETPEDLRPRRLADLSGGWQRLALIARAWITDPDLLLLDEPTNHLDLQRLEILENWINHATADVAMLIASHDRQFLDNCTTHTLFLRPDRSQAFAHPFTRARTLLAHDDAERDAQQARAGKEAERLRRNAGQLKNVGINSGSDLLLKKAKQLAGRAEAIEQSIRPAAKQRSGDIRLTNSGTHAKVLMTLDNVTVATPDGTPLYRTGTLRLFQQDRVVILGPNGAGKSCLIALLRRALQARETIPGITVSPTVSVGYLDQMMTQLPSDRSPLDFITSSFRLGDQRSRSLLAGAGFDIDTQSRRIATLSPGQRARLGLLAIRLAEPNLYLMDEPTNHIDIAGQERLEQEILEHEATCVLVSHDRFFVQTIGTRFWRIIGRALVEDEAR